MRRSPVEAQQPQASQLDPEKLDALAVALERSASWFPAAANPEPAPISESSNERDESAPPPESRVRASARPLGKKERRELERKQHVLAAQRANAQRRERQRKREQLRAERLAARKHAPQPKKIVAAKVAPAVVATESVAPAQPPRRGAIATALAWLLRKG